MATKKYPFLNLGDVTRPLRDEIVDAVVRVIDSGRYVGGEECRMFEEELAAATGTRYCVGVSNGLDALRLIFRAYIELGALAPGDEVIVPANTYIASVLAVTDCGLKPVFVEPNAETLNLDWTEAEKAVTSRTRALLTVHLYGRISWDEEIAGRLMQKGILIVEDNAQAIGAITPDGLHTGALGNAAAFSFYPTKNIGALGDAGAVTSDNRELAEMVRALANYGSDKRYHNIVKGYNCRLDPIQATVLRVKLAKLEKETERRRELARIYSSNITSRFISLPVWEDSPMVWHQFVVRTEHRDKFTEYLDACGIGWDIHYAVPPHRQPCYKEYSHLHLPVTDKISQTVISLPMGPTTTPADAVEISALINSFRP